MNQIAATMPTTSTRTRGLVFALLGILIFSGSLPATRIAVASLDAFFVTAARAVVAAALGGLCLLLMRAPRPARLDILPLVGVAAGVVVGFPLLTGLALKSVSSSHSTVFVGLLPLSTAIFGILRGGERPRPRFWIFAIAGSGLTAAYALGSGGLSVSRPDLMMLAAITVCGYGYAEGAQLTRRLGGWQVISWALLAALPIMLPLAWITAPADFSAVTPAAWAGLAYVSLFSMLIGFVFWYAGLAEGGTASAGQLQLLQPFLSFLWAGLLLGETITWQMLGATVGILALVTAARRNA